MQQRWARLSQSWLCDFGHVMKPLLAIDAKAIEDILHRQGICRLKQIDVSYCWLRDEVRFKRLRVRRVISEEKVDLGIKALSKAVVSKHSITSVYVNRDEEKVEGAQQAAAMIKASKWSW